MGKENSNPWENIFPKKRYKATPVKYPTEEELLSSPEAKKFLGENKKAKMYAVEIAGARTQDNDSDSEFIYFDQEKNSYVLSGKLISIYEAREIIGNLPNLAEEDKKRLGL